MSNQNLDVKEYARQKNVYLWQIAQVLGMNDGNFSRKLRKELPNEEKQQIIEIIDRIAKEGDKT